MTQPLIISHSKLREEMVAVAQGKRPASPDASRRSFESVEALRRVLTHDNRRLLAIIGAR